MDALANYFIRKYPENFVSGTDDCNIILMKNGQVYTLQNILMLIAIGINYNPMVLNVFDAHDYIKSRLVVDSRFQKLSVWSDYLKTMFGVNAQIVAYPTIPEYAENNWIGSEQQYPFMDIKFYFHQDGKNSCLITGADLQRYIHQFLNYNSDIGTDKAMNDHLSTYLQYWNRNCLGKYLKIVDLDGSFYNLNRQDAKNALLEIKRSDVVGSDGLWHPYIRDYANYKLYDVIANGTGSKFFLMKHLSEEKVGNILLDDNYILSLYDITGLNDTEYWKLKNNNIRSGEFLNTSYLTHDITLGQVCDYINRYLTT